MTASASALETRSPGRGRYRRLRLRLDRALVRLPLLAEALTLRPLAGAPAATVLSVAADALAGPDQLTLLVRLDDAPPDARLAYELRVAGYPELSATIEVASGLPVTAPQPGSFAPADPSIDYRARDFEALTNLMLQTISDQVGPNFLTNPVAQTVAVVEELAYLGDSLSYLQDAVATEAYLGTARRRVSVTRHANLLDYQVDEGCNARTWARIAISGNAPVRLAAGTPILATVPGAPARLDALADLAAGTSPVVFETMTEVELRAETPPLRLWDVEHPDGRLAPGATSAVVEGRSAGLVVGAVVLIEGTGAVGCDGANRVVRLIRAEPGRRVVGGREVDVVELAWARGDALPTGFEPWPTSFRVRTGNLVLCDEGRSVPEDGGERWLPLPVPDDGRTYAPRLPAPGLVFAARLVDKGEGAMALLDTSGQPTLPAVDLEEKVGGEWVPWSVRRSLLESGPFARDVVVEVENDRIARLRFGNGTNGLRPVPGAELRVRMRVGGGPVGNCPVGSLGQVVTDQLRVTGVTNPVAAVGGREPEPLSAVRLYAPRAFRRNERAVTIDDYVAFAREETGVVDAQAALLATGTWPLALVYVLTEAGPPDDAPILAAVDRRLRRRCLAGVELATVAAARLPVDILLDVRVLPGYDLASVSAAVDAALGAEVLAPGKLRLGAALYQSDVISTVVAAAGVADATALRFQAVGAPSTQPAAAIRPRLGEVVHAANEPGRPELGSLRYRLDGIR